MPKTTGNPIMIKTFTIAISILLGLGALGIFTSQADVTDTVRAEIEANDKLDDRKYFGKDQGIRLQEQVGFIRQISEETADDVKEINKQMTQQYILLKTIIAKLDYRKDSL